jgi:hypothetical protein
VRTSDRNSVCSFAPRATVAANGLGLGPSALRGDPALQALFLDRDRERLVERRVVLHVDHLVRELVKDEPREIGLAVADEARQHRIVEITERGISRHTADVDVVAIAREA